MINFFETVEVTLNRDVDVSDEFFPIDKHLFIHTNVFKDSDRGKYEVCTVKKGSRVFVFMKPNGNFSMTDKNGGSHIHAELQAIDFTLPPNVRFVNSMKPMPGKIGMFKY